MDRITAALHALRGHFDVVIVDAGSSGCFTGLNRPPRRAGFALPDACVLVYAQDGRSADGDLPHVDVCIPLIGVVENLATAAAA
jgi:hypothetical protein